MSSTEKPPFLHWKKALPAYKTKPREASQRVRLKFEETRKKLQQSDRKVGVDNFVKISPPSSDRPDKSELNTCI